MRLSAPFSGQSDSGTEAALRGEILFGDDFGEAEVEQWYADEAEAYADLGARERKSYRYEYHALNVLHGFRHLPPGSINDVLGFGSAYGDELAPIIDRVRAITIVDPSAAFACDSVLGRPSRYVQPSPDGRLRVESESVDLITCFGVLHHIPNVSFVFRELVRTLRPGGHLLVREPIVSMGDWRQPRPGLTIHERGIPLHLLRRMADSSPCELIRATVCDFSLTSRLFKAIRADPYNSKVVSLIDAGLSKAFAWNSSYHARSVWARMRPTSAFLILRRK